MIRRTGVLVSFLVMFGIALGCAQPRGVQPLSAPSTQATLEEAARLDKLVEQLRLEGTIKKAIPLAEQSLALREKALGPMHPDVATSLNNLAELCLAQGAYAQAETLWARALAIREKVMGARHPDVAEIINNLAELCLAQGAYTKAEALLVRALEILESALGPMHPTFAESLNNLAVLYSTQGAYAKAEPLAVRALDILEKTLGPMHRNVAVSLVTLAVLHQAQGAYAKAEPLFIRARDICEKVLGALHPDVATSTNSLALLYQAQGAYAKAEPLLVRALAIREETLGALHPEVANSLNNLAMLYEVQGAYAKAEPLLIRSHDIYEKVLGGLHPDVSSSLNNLATLYQLQGAYAKAEPLYKRALDISERVLGVMHPDVAQSLNNLALLYQAQGAYAKAEPLLNRALAIRERALGAMHPEVAQGLNNLAVLYQALGAYAKAEPLLIRSLGIREKALGAMHPDVAASLNSLAVLYLVQGAYAKAEPLYSRALDIREKSLGATHPDVASSLNNLAALYNAQGAYTKAVSLLARAAEIREAQLRLDLARLSEPRKRALMMLLQKETDSVLSLPAAVMASNPQALELALITVMRRKGRVLDSRADNQAVLRAHLTPELREKLDQFAAASTELSTRLRASFDPHAAASHASAITELRTRVEELEATLNTASADFRAQSEPLMLAKIQAVVPRGAALVEFVRYHRIDPRQAQPRQEERYVACILSRQGPPQWVALGEAAPIDAGVDAVLAAMHSDTSVDAAKTALQHLDTLVFAPLRDRLTNVSHVILSPDGKLNLVPFEALVDSQGHYEMEQRLVSYVTSGRDLLRLAERHAPRSSPTIIAAPDYGPPSSPALSDLGTFRPLEGATAEAAELPAYFVHARMLTGNQATKAALAATVGPAVLHIATHGFYARHTSATPASSNKSTGSIADASTAALSTPLDFRGIYVAGDAFSAFPPPPSPSEDPTEALDRAGLALAGANVRSDGVVSARELASYDWWGTKLVVLSACETGVGAVPSGEGVYGMRRALVLAGAESQVVSLWNVSDASTRELMRAFYSELARGTGRAEALRRAKLRLLRQPKFAHPYYWAAFIPAGDWTPLDPHLLKQQEHGR